MNFRYLKGCKKQMEQKASRLLYVPHPNQVSLTRQQRWNMNWATITIYSPAMSEMATAVPFPFGSVVTPIINARRKASVICELRHVLRKRTAMRSCGARNKVNKPQISPRVRGPSNRVKNKHTVLSPRWRQIAEKECHVDFVSAVHKPSSAASTQE